MNTMEQGIVTLLRSAITGEKLALPVDFRLEEAMELIRQHGMPTLVYQGAVNCGLDRQDPAMQRLFQSYIRTMLAGEAQMKECERIFAAFDQQGIDYMPLKGCRMKALYPKQELRVMGDADILIRLDQYERIVPIMEQLGFTFKYESDHELVWDNKRLHLELHKRVIASFNEDFYAYFGDGWRLALTANGTRYSMKAEDEFVYLFTHFARHFRDGGIGCRHVVDLWVFLRSHPGLDLAAARRELDRIYLGEFLDHVVALIRWWFEDGEAFDRTEVIHAFLFNSGSQGERANLTRSAMIKRMKHALPIKNQKLAYIWSGVFPTWNALKREYPVLEKMPLLAPFVWCHRLCSRLLAPREEWAKRAKQLDMIGDNSMTAHQELLNYVGLDYHF